MRVDDFVVTGEETATASELIANAHWWWMNGNLQRALQGFELVFRALPEQPVSAYALYWAALVEEQAGDHRAAAGDFELVGARFPAHPWAADASLRAVRLWGFLGDWGRAGGIARDLLVRSRPWLPVERVALRSARALDLLERGAFDAAEREVARGRRVVDLAGLDRLPVLPRDLAQLFYAQAELDRLHARQLGFEGVDGDFARRFEQRAQLLLDAQAGYLEAMRAHDAHWTTMAGYRLSTMYRDLHADVMAVDLPSAVPAHRRELFRAAMRLRYLVLLEKAASLNARTISVAERTSTDSAWVERARVQARELQTTLDAERAALDNGPFTRVDLQRVLDEVQARQ